MRPLRAHVIYGDPRTKEWKSVVSFDVEAVISPDWSGPLDAENLGSKWNAVALPNGEEIEIGILVRENDDRCTINVRQRREPIAQVICEGNPSFIFRTLAGAAVNIQFAAVPRLPRPNVP